MYKKLLLLLFVTLCFCFACNNYYEKIVNPVSPFIIKCEGIVLDTVRSYHITDKGDLDALKRIRGNEVDISGNDVLLHYREANMQYVTPSYWGTLYHDKFQWKFTLDKSFTVDPNRDKTLPFLRFAKRENDKICFVKPSSILNESELQQKLFVNYHSGDASSRYYLQLKQILRKDILPFFDDGVKRSYPIKADGDSIKIAFNSKIKKPTHFNFNFDNTSKAKGVYTLVYNPKSINKFELIGKKSTPVKSEFQVEDMMFSITGRYSLLNKILLGLYILIATGSALFYVRKINVHKSSFSQHLNRFKVVLASFILLGFPVLAIALDGFDFGLFRRFILCVVVPSVFFITSLYCWVKEKCRWIWLKSQQDRIVLILKTNKYLWFIVLFLLIISVVPLFFTSNERVLGLFPTLHYAKILIFITSFITFSNEFGGLIKKIVQKFPIRKKHRYIIPFIPAIVLLFLAIIISALTKDIGILLFTFLSALIIETVVFKKRLGKFKFWWLLIIYPVIVCLLFVSSNYLDFGRKTHRLTYTLTNPQSSFYENTVDADRETFAFQYHALQQAIAHPLGIKNLNIPASKKSVSHTDYAIMWSVVDNGITFLILLLIGISYLSYSLSFLIRRLTLVTTENGTNNLFLRSFLAFVLIMLLLQCLIPLASNLALPFGFFTGIPFPFISISIGDALFIFILIILLDSISSEFINEKENILTNTSSKSALNYTAIIALGIILWISIKILMFNIQDSKISYWEKDMSNEIIDNIKHKAFKNNEELLVEINKQFADKDMESLNKKDKIAGAFCNALYYKNDPKKLLSESPYFRLDGNDVLNKINLDSLFSSYNEVISGKEWAAKKYTPVFIQKHFLNGKQQTNTSSEYFSNLDLNNPTLNPDISALLNKELKNYVVKSLKGFGDLKISVLIIDNSNSKIVVNSSYPFLTKHPENNLNFYPGSIKKVLLASFISNQNIPLVHRDLPLNLKNNKFGDYYCWFGTSNNYASQYIWDTFISNDLNNFKKSLKAKFKLSWQSLNYENGFAGKGFNRDKKSVYRTFIGGEVKYTPLQINKWFSTMANDCFLERDKKLLSLLKQPLIHKKGTAKIVSTALKKEGLDVHKFIAKTGTLQLKEGTNIASSFIISNKNYTISVLIDGKQPPNSSRRTAKHLLVRLIPHLKLYLLAR